MAPYRQIRFEYPDGRQVLVEIWSDEPAELLERSSSDAIWSIPIEATSDKTLERLS